MDLRASTGALVTTPSDGGRYEASDSLPGLSMHRLT
jgi:hypothetical protein